jgi:peptidoglycan hydrolase-like protein with peptidoglycan-binding domain
VGLQIFEGASGRKFVCDADGGFGATVAAISKRANAPIMSCAREPAAESLLRQLGLHSQKQLFDCAQTKKNTGNCPPDCVAASNCNAANPPGHSTHERFNDGIAYSIFPGAPFRLPVWARGIDVQIDRVKAFCDEARREGFTVTLTYPGSAQEAQHVNFRKQPKISIWDIRPLREGMRGPRVSLVVRLLWQIRDPQTKRPYLDPHIRPHGNFTPQVRDAIKAFQRDHHQDDDGVVGIHTIRALRGALRLQKKKP